MAAPRRTKRNESEARTQYTTAALVKAIEEAVGGYQQVVEEYRRSALRAAKRGHQVEAAILSHIADRFSAPGSTSEELEQFEREFLDLTSFLPIPKRQRDRGPLERKAGRIRFIRGQKLDRENEGSLIWLATQRPGRPVDTRAVAIRALEMHKSGQNWAQIEKRLLPQRRNSVNPGRSINREVQFLISALRRYSVQLDRF